MRATNKSVGSEAIKETPVPGYEHELRGKHSAICVRHKHEDWQHGVTGCAVGREGIDHCDCTAHWVEIRPTRFGQ